MRRVPSQNQIAQMCIHPSYAQGMLIFHPNKGTNHMSKLPTSRKSVRELRKTWLKVKFREMTGLPVSQDVLRRLEKEMVIAQRREISEDIRARVRILA